MCYPEKFSILPRAFAVSKELKVLQGVNNL